jgi:hypothetical protein
MSPLPRTEPFHSLFELCSQAAHRPGLASSAVTPRTIPDPDTGRPLQVAAVELSVHGICPACAQRGAGGYVSFVSDLRLAFACPSCRTLVWLAGA